MKETKMSSARNVEVPRAERMPARQPQKKRPVRWYRRAGWLFAPEAVRETVATRLHFDAAPEDVWNHIMLYEEVPGRAPFLLRTLLPPPVRTEGEKTHVGARVRCTYEGGYLVKRITAVEPPHDLQFEVVEQKLGIEDGILTLGGSYQIRSRGGAAEVVLTTNYESRLAPRRLWRPLEALLVHQLHRHILRGVGAEIRSQNPAGLAAAADSHRPQSVASGGLACTMSQSASRR
jgi:hypothetical protein